MTHVHAERASESSDRVIAALRELSEEELRRDFIIPLLKAMGATHVEHVHGPFERGKDLIYVRSDAFQDSLLGVVQAKNEPLSGSFSSRSSAGTALQQLLHCAETEILNPATNMKELPREVLFVTTYNLPDAPLADAANLLAKVRRQCKVIGPEKLAALLRDHLPRLYSSLAFPGTGLANAIRSYVAVHREWSAFESSAERPLDSFYVNLSVAPCGGVFGSLVRGQIQPRRVSGLTLPQEDYDALAALYSQVPDVHSHPPLLGQIAQRFGSDAGKASRVRQPRSERASRRALLENVTLRKVNIAGFISRLEQYARNSQVHRGSRSSVIDTIGISAALINSLAIAFGDDLFSHTQESAAQRPLVIPDLLPDELIAATSHIAIIADAGSGKTCFAQRLADSALANGVPCIYFPCSRIQTTDTPLLTALYGFLRSIDAVTDSTSFADAMRATRLIILDGADEAATFGPTLGRQITNLLHVPKEIRVDGCFGSKCRVPDELSAVVLRRDDTRRKGCYLSVTRPLRTSDYGQLCTLNEGTAFGAAFLSLREECASKSPRLIVTSRDISSLDFPDLFTETSLLPFTEVQLFDFMDRWFEASTKKRLEIKEFLERNSHIKAVCANPMTATIVASLHENNFALPHSRAEVYERRFELLLERWDRLRNVKRVRRVSKPDKKHFLRQLAYVLHSKHRRRFSVAAASRIWSGACADRYKGLEIADVLAELRACDGVIVPEGDEYSLGHLSFQEYLAAEYVVHGQHIDVLVDNFNDTWWRNVVLFYAGITGDVHKLLSRVQRKFPLQGRDGLLDEILREARNTPGVVRKLIAQFGSEDRADEGSPLDDE
ncbi:MAG TPA: hypothetical protein VHZ24_22525 [Pirellulales bacterium]|nr:hypothetical protein [Pirellulales bacterium]